MAAIDRGGIPAPTGDGSQQDPSGGGPHPVRALQDVSLDLWPGEQRWGWSRIRQRQDQPLARGSARAGRARCRRQPDPRWQGAGRDRSSGRGPDQMKALQIIFQNPDSALNRSHRVRRLIGRPWSGWPVVAQAAAAGSAAGADAVRTAARSNPRPAPALQLSGGLKQRVAIARAFGERAKRVVVW